MPRSKGQRRAKGADRLRKRLLASRQPQQQAVTYASLLTKSPYFNKPLTPWGVLLITRALEKMREDPEMLEYKSHTEHCELDDRH
jgi:hypothetical protein